MRVVIVRVIVDGVLGVIVVLIGHDEVLVIYVAIFVVIFCNWRCTLYRERDGEIETIAFAECSAAWAPVLSSKMAPFGREDERLQDRD